MRVTEAIRMRRSIRKFKDRRVSLDLIWEIIDYARWAPSSKNRQPWEFIVTFDKKKIDFISKAKGQEWICEVPAIILIISDPNKSPVYHDIDTAMAVQNISLAALEYGLGTCWIGIYENKEVKRLFKIPDNLILVGALAIGYPAETPAPRSRKSVDEILYIDEYGRSK